MTRVTTLALILMIVLVACSSGEDSTPEAATIPLPDPTPTQEAVDSSAQTTTEDTTVETTTEEMTVETNTEPEAQTVAYNGPDWTMLELTNAVTGETFTLADFAGQAVYVHPMATWCTNCGASQRNILNNVLPRVGDEPFAFISVSVETNLSTDALASYAERNGFSWTFAVATPEVLSALINHFGSSVSQPPVQPHFILAADGTPSNLMTGSDSADNIINNLSEAAGA